MTSLTDLVRSGHQAILQQARISVRACLRLHNLLPWFRFATFGPQNNPISPSA